MPTEVRSSEGLGISARDARLKDMYVLAGLRLQDELRLRLQADQAYETTLLTLVWTGDDLNRVVVLVLDSHDVLPPEERLTKVCTSWVAALWKRLDPYRLVRVMLTKSGDSVFDLIVCPDRMDEDGDFDVQGAKLLNLSFG